MITIRIAGPTDDDLFHVAYHFPDMNSEQSLVLHVHTNEVTGHLYYFSIPQAQYIQENATKYNAPITVTITKEKTDGTPYDTTFEFIPGGTIDTVKFTEH